jgi:hypothetical protein
LNSRQELLFAQAFSFDLQTVEFERQIRVEQQFPADRIHQESADQIAEFAAGSGQMQNGGANLSFCVLCRPLRGAGFHGVENSFERSQRRNSSISYLTQRGPS